MDNREEIKKELSELAPKLGSVEKGNPFSVPDYYFQGLPDNVLKSVNAQPLPWIDKLESWLNTAFALIFRPRYAIPASAFLLGLIVAINFNKGASDNHAEITRQLAAVSDDDMSDYIVENFDEDDWTALTVSAQQELIIPKDIPSEELENYFNNNFDNQTLEEEIL